MITNNSLLVLFCPPPPTPPKKKYMKSQLWRPTISKFSSDPCAQTLLGWLAPSDLTLIHAECYAWLDTVETSAQNPDQISGSWVAKDTDQETAPWQLHCTTSNIIVRLKQYFHISVKSTNLKSLSKLYTYGKVNMCGKKWGGENHENLSRFMTESLILH